MTQGSKPPKSEVVRDDQGRVVSGTPNPSGVSKERARCRKLFEESAEEFHGRLLKIIREETDDKWLAFEALKLGLSYAIGKPNVIITGEDGGPLKVDGDLLGSLARLAEKGTSG